MSAKSTKAAKKDKSASTEIVVQTRRGMRRPEDRVPVSAVQIPDLWNGFTAVRGIAEKIREENQSKNIIIDDRAKILERFAGAAEETWDMAQDMHHCLQQTVQPAVRNTLDHLRDLMKKSEEGQIIKGYWIKEAIEKLEAALKDGQDKPES
jgi:hypothetical protein